MPGSVPRHLQLRPERFKQRRVGAVVDHDALFVSSKDVKASRK